MKQLALGMIFGVLLTGAGAVLAGDPWYQERQLQQQNEEFFRMQQLQLQRNHEHLLREQNDILRLRPC